MKNSNTQQNLKAAGLAIFVTLASTIPAKAENCPYLQEGLVDKQKEYKLLAQKHIDQINSLLASEASCKAKGVNLSNKAAAIATGEAYQAQAEVATLQLEMQANAEKCSAIFEEIEAAQLKLWDIYKVSKADVDGALEFMADSKILQKYCGQEIQATVKMARNYLDTQKSMITGIQRNRGDQKDYDHLAKKAESVSNIASALNKAGGEMKNGSLGIHAVDAKAGNQSSGLIKSDSGITAAKTDGKSGLQEVGGKTNAFANTYNSSVVQKSNPDLLNRKSDISASAEIISKAESSVSKGSAASKQSQNNGGFNQTSNLPTNASAIASMIHFANEKLEEKSQVQQDQPAQFASASPQSASTIEPSKSLIKDGSSQPEKVGNIKNVATESSTTLANTNVSGTEELKKIETDAIAAPNAAEEIKTAVSQSLATTATANTSSAEMAAQTPSEPSIFDQVKGKLKNFERVNYPPKTNTMVAAVIDNQI